MSEISSPLLYYWTIFIKPDLFISPENCKLIIPLSITTRRDDLSRKCNNWVEIRWWMGGGEWDNWLVFRWKMRIKDWITVELRFLIITTLSLTTWMPPDSELNARSLSASALLFLLFLGNQTEISPVCPVSITVRNNITAMGNPIKASISIWYKIFKYNICKFF